MTPKGANLSKKRKDAPSKQHDKEMQAKKPKLAPKRKVFETDNTPNDSDYKPHFEGLSDSSDGGVELKGKRGAGPSVRQSEESKQNGSAPSGKTFERGQNSKESHALQKQLAQERRAAKPLADELHRTKKIWEKLRRKSHVPKEERQALVDELYTIITGRIKDFVLKHDAVRAVQTAVKYSTPVQRKQIAKELQGTYAQLAESRYAKFLIGKLLVQDDNEIRDIVIPEFYGKVRRLINHPEASWILDDVYRGVATKDQKAILLREWYGPEFALFQLQEGVKPNADLFRILEDEPSKRGTVMKYLLDMVNQLIQKKMTGFTMLHDAMLQYFLNVKPESEEFTGFFELVKGDENGDLLKNMAFTKSGARLVCLLLAYGSSKDRKLILKTYKDTFQLMCGDAHAHTVILAAYDLVDDTKYLAKAIFPEILGVNQEKEVENVIFCANNLNARTTICYLLEGMSKSLFPASHAADLEILKEIHEIRKTTSKKDPDVRRKELIAALSPPLLAAITTSSDNLVSTSFGCQFVTDALLSAEGDKASALKAIASTAAGDPAVFTSEDTYPPPSPHISLTPFGCRMFKTLISGGRFDKQTGQIRHTDPPLHFADLLYPVIQDHIVTWATGPSSFAVVSLLEAEDFSNSEELRSTLQANDAVLEKAATEKTPEQKQQTEAEVAGDGRGKGKAASKGKKQSAAKQERVVGNPGTKILLEKLRD